jgi:DNA-directed RNA polymerase specialized sigma24 family protein
MPVSEELLDRARDLDPVATESLLSDVYPSVRRIALALVADDGAARAVARGVLDRGLRVLPGWRSGATPENWFYHHTVLAAREVATVRPPRSAADGNQDPLVARASFADPAYTAFVRAVRGLPEQQAEAYLLYHGERLNERLLGVAMDCSAAAAANHLQAATDALTAMSGGDLTRCTAILAKAYVALAPDASEATVLIRPSVRRARRRRRFRTIVRAFLALVLVALLAYLGWAAWHWRHVLQQLWAERSQT